MSYIDDYIMTLPKKYNTILGESGINLSGGQKQRLSIARSLCKKSKIILFDEATSALDNKSQEYIKKTIDSLVKDHTVMIVAHRLSTIVDADIIHVVKKGKVVDSGISLNLDDVFPIILRKAYYKDYPQIGNNRKNEIYYYVIKTDKVPNLELTNLTDDEKDGNFKLEYIKLDDIEEVIIKNGDKNGDLHGITNEMLEVIKIYKNKFLK